MYIYAQTRAYSHITHLPVHTCMYMHTHISTPTHKMHVCTHTPVSTSTTPTEELKLSKSKSTISSGSLPDGTPLGPRRDGSEGAGALTPS